MSSHSISIEQARTLHLAAQGLLRPLKRKARFDDVMRIIRQMSLLQIDTIHVVARSPYLVLFSRLGDFPESWLGEALTQGKLFEYWAHEACFIPSEDYPLLRHRMLNPERMGWKYNREWVETWQDEITELLAHIADKGPVRSADFSAPAGQKAGWWAWKPYKRHLENLFTAGELMVIERRNFQRVYDLRQRVMPEWDDEQHALSEDDAVQEMLRRSASSLGVFKAAWLADYYRLKRAPVKETLARWLDEKEVIDIEVEQLGQCYLHHSLLPLLASGAKSTCVTLLSPFDPVVWDRKRTSELFGFDYRLECYTPEAKRQYGYFVLPVLHRGALKGRLDARMQRKEKVLCVRQLWLEEKTRVSQTMMEELQLAISRFARWQGAEAVLVENLPEPLKQVWGKGWPL